MILYNARRGRHITCILALLFAMHGTAMRMMNTAALSFRDKEARWGLSAGEVLQSWEDAGLAAASGLS